MSARPPARPEEGPAKPGGGLARAVGALRRVARATLWLAAAALAGGVAVWWALREGLGGDEGRGVILTVAGLLLLAPPAILGLFAVALRALADMPRRLREAPGELGERAAHVRRRAAELAEARRRGPFAGLRAVARLWWAAASSREVLEVLSPAAVLLTPGLLAATAVAAVAAVIEVLLGLGALLVLGS